MPCYRADIPTKNASRYLQQLCKHWAHRATADYTKTAGRVTFDVWQVELEAAHNNLGVTIHIPDEKSQERYGKVVADHLQRFATQEELAIEWF